MGSSKADSSQDERPICLPPGRDCFNRLAHQTFNCSVSCDGTYADIERVEEGIVAAQIGDHEEEMNALQLLVKEYEDYKKRYTESLMFNATASFSNYGGFGIENNFHNFVLFLSNRATLFVASADPDLLRHSHI